MSRRHLTLPLLLALAVPAVAGASDRVPGNPAGAVPQSCVFNGFALKGKVQVVEHFPDIKVQVVEHFPDLKVKTVQHFPDDCGEWQFVEHFPDFKIQYVQHFPDVKIQFVEHFPGVP
jgi:hypothetical protein